MFLGKAGLIYGNIGMSKKRDPKASLAIQLNQLAKVPLSDSAYS